MLKLILGALVLMQSVGVLAFRKSGNPMSFRVLAAVMAVGVLAFLVFELVGGWPGWITPGSGDAAETAPRAERGAGAQAGESFRDCTQCPEMVVVPAGTFMMGSWFDEEGRLFNEMNRHPVKIGSAFAIGRFEVTVEEWRACRNAGGCPGLKEGKGGKEGKLPVSNVSWEDARAYAGWLSRKTGHTYRLPSEAEWEYAARGGSPAPFSFGETISAGQANYDGRFAYDLGQEGVFRGHPVPVGSFAANGFGLHDMHGNVSEWTQDCWNFGFGKKAPAEGSARLNGECGWRLVRGGSWADEPRYLRAAARTARLKDLREEPYLGFRVVRETGARTAAGGMSGNRRGGAS